MWIGWIRYLYNNPLRTLSFFSLPPVHTSILTHPFSLYSIIRIEFYQEYVSGDRLRKGGDCERPELIKADPKRVEAASSSFRSMTRIGEKTPDIAQACMRPCPPDAIPVMGRIDGIEGAYVSAGHNVRLLPLFS